MGLLEGIGYIQNNPTKAMHEFGQALMMGMYLGGKYCGYFRTKDKIKDQIKE